MCLLLKYANSGYLVHQSAAAAAAAAAVAAMTISFNVAGRTVSV